MSLIYNGTEIKKLLYNNINIKTMDYNGSIVYNSSVSKNVQLRIPHYYKSSKSSNQEVLRNEFRKATIVIDDASEIVSISPNRVEVLEHWVYYVSTGRYVDYTSFISFYADGNSVCSTVINSGIGTKYEGYYDVDLVVEYIPI